MTRALIAVPASDPGAVLDALRSALANDGPAVFPLAVRRAEGMAASSAERTPTSVSQRIAVVVETSGSSGRPKRVALSSNALLASAAASDTALGGPGQWLLALPAHYIAGINVLVRSLAAGTAPVMMPPGHFEPSEFIEQARRMDASGPRYTSLVPAQLVRLLGQPTATDLTVLRAFDRILLGGQATPAALIARAGDLGLRTTRTYGSSETSGGCVYDGVPLAGVHAEVVGGQIELAGSMLAEGYLDEDFTSDVERTDTAFTSRGGLRWYRTGDAGTITDGALAVSGRRDRVIISGGLKVSLDDVERVIREFAGLEDAVAVPIGSARWGQSVALIVGTGDAGRMLRSSSIRSALVSRLGPAAAPARIIEVERIPMLASGKPDLQALIRMVAASDLPSARP